MGELQELYQRSPDMFDSIIGKDCGFRWMDYTWRDVAIYALGVGAHADDLPYIYERAEGGLKVLPTFGVIPYINSILMNPPTKVPYGPNEILLDFIHAGLGEQKHNRLHMAMEIIIHKPLDAMGGRLIIEDKVEKVLDWGDRGVVGITAEEVMDRAGNPVCTLKGTHWHRAYGNFGGEKYVSPKVEYPEREPDWQVSEYLADNQAALYRLAGDTYHVHIDPAVSQKRGYPKPFMQGLGTIGFATRMAVQAIMPYQPERVTRVYAQMRQVCVPGQNVTLKAWKIKEGLVHFRLENDEGGILLGNGVLEYKE